MKIDFNDALGQIKTQALDALKAAGKDATEAAKAVEAYALTLEPDAMQIGAALAQAATTGGDVQTWVNALTAQVEAAALYVVNELRLLSQQEADRVTAIAMDVLHAAVKIALA